MKTRYMEFLTDDIYIRTLELSDVGPDWIEFINDEEVTRYLKTKKATKEDLENYLVAAKRNRAIMLGIFCKIKEQSAKNPVADFLAHDKVEKVSVTKHIGNLRLDIQGETAYFAIALNKDFWGKGIGSRCLKHAIKIVYNLSDAKEILLEVQKENQKAISLYEDYGFRIIETTEPYKDGRLHYRMRLEL